MLLCRMMKEWRGIDEVPREKSLPLNSSRRLAGNIVGDSADAEHFVDDLGFTEPFVQDDPLMPTCL